MRTRNVSFCGDKRGKREREGENSSKPRTQGGKGRKAGVPSGSPSSNNHPHLLHGREEEVRFLLRENGKGKRKKGS